MEGISPSHGWDHVNRVRNMALHIAREEGVEDLDAVQVAALLHDVARQEEDNSHGAVCHAVEGARKARVFLEKMQCNEDFIHQVTHAVETHRYRASKRPQTLVASCLFDADKLDSIGATGIGRAFLFAGELGAILHNPEAATDPSASRSHVDTAYREYMVKLKHVKDAMLTPTGKKLARERHDFMEEYFDRLNREYLQFAQEECS